MFSNSSALPVIKVRDLKDHGLDLHCHLSVHFPVEGNPSYREKGGLKAEVLHLLPTETLSSPEEGVLD